MKGLKRGRNSGLIEKVMEWILERLWNQGRVEEEGSEERCVDKEGFYGVGRRRGR